MTTEIIAITKQDVEGENGVSEGAVHIHVDDLLFAGTKKFLERMEKLRERFQFDPAETGEFVHVGIQFQQDPKTGRVRTHQEKKIMALEEVEEEEGERGQLTERAAERFRSTAGAMLWITHATRPDVATATAELTGQRRPTVDQSTGALPSVFHRD